MIKILGVAVAAAIACTACGGPDADLPEDAAAGARVACNVDELTGTWRVEYAQTSGTCGAIADETFIAGLPDPSLRCAITTTEVSSDRCRLDVAFICPSPDGEGTASWELVIHQTPEGPMQATGAVERDHPALGGCRSTYDVAITPLR